MSTGGSGAERRRQALFNVLAVLGVIAVCFTGAEVRSLFLPPDIVAALQANAAGANVGGNGGGTTPALGSGRLFGGSVPGLRHGRRHGPGANTNEQTGETAQQADTQLADNAGLVVPGQPGGNPGPAPVFGLTDGGQVVPPGAAPGQPGYVDPGILGGNPGGPDVTGTIPTEPLPEPESWAMMAMGLAAAGWVIRRRRRATAA